MKEIIGVLENCTASHVHGFICIAKNSKPPTLDIYIDNSKVGTASYKSVRETSGLRSLSCLNFEFKFTTHLIGKRVINARTINGVELTNSPFIYCPDSLSNIFSNTKETKQALSQTFISGEGIEIGALWSPFPVKENVKVKYVDRIGVDQLRRHYSELANKSFVEVDIIDDGEVLATIANESQQFVIASHFIEHAKNPIGFLQTGARVLRKGGILLLAIPDKRHTFDVDRPLTSIDHIVGDHEIGHEAQKRVHFEEIVYFQHKLSGINAATEIEKMMNSDYSYHWHVWTSNSFLEFIGSILLKYSIPMEVVLFLKGKGEFYVVLMKV